MHCQMIRTISRLERGLDERFFDGLDLKLGTGLAQIYGGLAVVRIGLTSDYYELYQSYRFAWSPSRLNLNKHSIEELRIER